MTPKFNNKGGDFRRVWISETIFKQLAAFGERELFSLSVNQIVNEALQLDGLCIHPMHFTKPNALYKLKSLRIKSVLYDQLASQQFILRDLGINCSLTDILCGHLAVYLDREDFWTCNPEEIGVIWKVEMTGKHDVLLSHKSLGEESFVSDQLFNGNRWVPVSQVYS